MASYGVWECRAGLPCGRTPPTERCCAAISVMIPATKEPSHPHGDRTDLVSIRPWRTHPGPCIMANVQSPKCLCKIARSVSSMPVAVALAIGRPDQPLSRAHFSKASSQPRTNHAQDPPGEDIPPNASSADMTCRRALSLPSPPTQRKPLPFCIGMRVGSTAKRAESRLARRKKS